MGKKMEKSDIEQLMANVEAEGGKLASLGCGLDGYSMRFGGPEGDISPDIERQIRESHRHSSDELVASALEYARENISPEWLDAVETRIETMAVVLEAELRGLLEPTRANGMVAQYWGPNGEGIAVMGGAPLTPEQIAEDIQNYVPLDGEVQRQQRRGDLVTENDVDEPDVDEPDVDEPDVDEEES